MLKTYKRMKAEVCWVGMKKVVTNWVSKYEVSNDISILPCCHDVVTTFKTSRDS